MPGLRRRSCTRAEAEGVGRRNPTGGERAAGGRPHRAIRSGTGLPDARGRQQGWMRRKIKEYLCCGRADGRGREDPGRSRAPYGEHDDNQIQGRGWHQGHDFSGTKVLSSQKACRAVNHGRKPGIGDILFRRIRMPGWTDFQGHGFKRVWTQPINLLRHPEMHGAFQVGNEGFMTAEGKRKNFGVTQQHAQRGAGSDGFSAMTDKARQADFAV